MSLAGVAINEAIRHRDHAFDLKVDSQASGEGVIVEGQLGPMSGVSDVAVEVNGTSIALPDGHVQTNPSALAPFRVRMPAPGPSDLATARIVASQAEGGRLPLGFLFFRSGSGAEAPCLQADVLAGSSAFDPLDRAVKKLMRDWELPGATLAVGCSGGLVHARAFGWADAQAGIAMAPAMRQRLGSLTKPVTAAAILTLLREERESLDSQLSAYLPWPREMGPAPSIRHLLHNASGLKSPPEAATSRLDALTKDEAIGSSQPVAPDRIALALSQIERQADPAVRFDYQPFNYWCLGRVIETLSGLSYARFVQESVLRPLGLDDSVFFGGSFPDRFVPGEIGLNEGDACVPAPSWSGLAGTWPPGYVDSLSGRDSSAGLVASASSANLLFQHLWSVQPSVLKPDDLEALVHQLKTEVPSAPGWHYGAGVFVERSAPSASGSGVMPRRWWHFGSLSGAVGIVYGNQGITTTLLFNKRPKGWKLLLASLLGMLRKHLPPHDALPRLPTLER